MATQIDSSKITKPKKNQKKIQTLRGMRDILPEEQKYWDCIRSRTREFQVSYGFQRIDLPILESEQLFVRSVGKTSDIIEKEMYNFVDQGGEKIALRPEATASVVRAYIEHGLVNQPQPIKLFYEGPMFRRDRPQAGRYRQFHQFGFEVLGSVDPLLDAQLMFINYRLLLSLGLKTIVHINSIGCPECRPAYHKLLIGYYRTKRSELCDNCRQRLNKNPLRLLDCKEENCQKLKGDAPQLVDNLCEPCRNHFMKVLDYLDEMDVPYFLNHALVRGLDYYTKTVFEFLLEDDEEESRQNSLGGGGRYDGLVEEIGGRPTPACGIAMGTERIINALKAKAIEVPLISEFDIFVAQLGEEAKKKSLVLFEELRAAGFHVAENLAKEGLKAQLETANKLNVKFSLILGHKEIMDGTIMIRDMENGIQEIVDLRKVVPELKKRLDKQITVVNGN